MSIRVPYILIVLAAACLAAPATAQVSEPAAQPEAEQAEPEAPPVAAQAPSLEQAYQREFAFLQGQKRDLERRIDEFDESSTADRQQLQSDIRSLERQVVELTSRGDQLEEQVFESERSVESARDNVNLLANTFLQAEATIEDWQAPQLEGDEVPQADDVAAMFETVRAELKRRGTVHQESGEFFLADGTRVDGEIIHVGRIASFGVSERGAGALAPAGEGELKLWNEDSADAARALEAGTMVSPLPIFIFETLSSEVEEKGSKGVFETIASGGVIGWIIFFLGLLAAALVALRAVFLWRAGTSTGRILDDVSTPVRRGDREAALSVLKKRQGATARVVASAIRNLDRDREHLEDIVSESILHESGHLNRFGAFIMVIAAVSPLLGLLGTVTGMISTFDVITEFGTGDPKLLSGGISIALVTTELGLIVAIPTLLFGNLLSSWAERIKDDLEKATLRVTNQYLEARGDTEQVGG